MQVAMFLHLLSSPQAILPVALSPGHPSVAWPRGPSPQVCGPSSRLPGPHRRRGFTQGLWGKEKRGQRKGPSRVLRLSPWDQLKLPRTNLRSRGGHSEAPPVPQPPALAMTRSLLRGSHQSARWQETPAVPGCPRLSPAQAEDTCGPRGAVGVPVTFSLPPVPKRLPHLKSQGSFSP